MVTAGQTSTRHRADIQGLRAVAVLLVIGDHAGIGWLAGGFVGVDVFFVVSGYLITLLLLAEGAATGRVGIGRFYARRARRILPAATLVLLVTMFYAAHELPLSRVQQLREDATWSALFAVNVHFGRSGTDYFDQGREPSAFQHYWSLAVEEQFYLVWPLLVAVVLIAMARRHRNEAGRTRALTWLLVLVVVVSSAWSMLQTQTAPGEAYYSSAGRAWELGIGALLAVQQPALARLAHRTRGWLGLAGLLWLGVAATTYEASSAFPGWRALLPVLGAAAIVAAGTGGSSSVNRVLTIAPLTWLGGLSYSLYLWHWPILVLGPGHAAVFTGARGTLLLLGITLVASLVTYHLVENPFRQAALLRRGRRAFVLWPVALGAVLLGVTAAERQAAAQLEQRLRGAESERPPPAPVPRLLDKQAREGQPTADRTSEAPSLADRLDDALHAADSGASIPFPLTNLPRTPDDVFRLPPACRADPLETSTGVCPAGDPGARRTIVVLGDSQAGQWLPALDLVGRADGYRVLPLVKLGCPPFDVPVTDGAGDDFWQCTEFRQWATRVIARTRPEVVVVSSEATSYRLRPAPGLDLPSTWAAGVRATLERLRDLGSAVVVLADTPDLAFDPVDCLTDPDARLDDCVGAPHTGLVAANVITRAVAEQSGAGYVDTVGLLCRRGRCPVVVDRTMTFMDYSHVSAVWSVALADDLRRLYRRTLTGLEDQAS